MSWRRWLGLGFVVLLLAAGGVVLLASGGEERGPSRLQQIRAAAEEVAGPERVSVARADGQQTELLVELPQERLSVFVATRLLDIESRIPPKGDETLGIFNDRLAMTSPESRAGKCLEQRLLELEGVSYSATSPLTMDDPPPEPARPRYC